MTRWIIATAVGLLMLCEMLLNVPNLFAGAFDELSPGNQKAVQSLFEAQRSDLPPGTRPLTRDEIAARKLGGEGWGRIFADMKARGLTDAKTFGQTVSSYNHRHHLSSAGTATTAANRTVGVGRDSAVRTGPGRHETRASSARSRQDDTRGGSAVSSSTGATHGRAHAVTSVQAHAGAANGHGRGK